VAAQLLPSPPQDGQPGPLQGQQQAGAGTGALRRDEEKEQIRQSKLQCLQQPQLLFSTMPCPQVCRYVPPLILLFLLLLRLLLLRLLLLLLRVPAGPCTWLTHSPLCLPRTPPWLAPRWHLRQSLNQFAFACCCGKQPAMLANTRACVLRCTLICCRLWWKSAHTSSAWVLLTSQTISGFVADC
jgi:hypothetical protein